jgi:lipopolysaccharide transport system permease protein
MSGHGKPWTAAGVIASKVWRNRKVLAAVTRVELDKRYSGSALGRFWLVLHPLLLLCIYLFVYAVVFRMQLPGYSGLNYAIFVFCGLIPFIGLSESLSAGTMCIKQNMHLVKNVMLPIELVPIRSVLASMVTQVVGMGVLLFLLVITGQLSPKILLLPLVFALQVLMLVGLVFVLAPLAVALSDVSYFVNLSIMLLMFVSPIGFTRELVPGPFAILIDLNPVTYMIEAYRFALLPKYPFSPGANAGFVVLALACFGVGSLFFERFKGVLVDYE